MIKAYNFSLPDLRQASFESHAWTASNFDDPVPGLNT
jgi:hypothetical protein